MKKVLIIAIISMVTVYASCQNGQFRNYIEDQYREIYSTALADFKNGDWERISNYYNPDKSAVLGKQQLICRDGKYFYGVQPVIEAYVHMIQEANAKMCYIMFDQRENLTCEEKERLVKIYQEAYHRLVGLYPELHEVFTNSIYIQDTPGHMMDVPIFKKRQQMFLEHFVLRVLE